MRGFRNSSFDPPTLVVLETAFDEAWLTLKSIGNTTVKPDELARSVLRLAMEGERDPLRLHDGALEGLIPATAWREASWSPGLATSLAVWLNRNAQEELSICWLDWLTAFGLARTIIGLHGHATNEGLPHSKRTGSPGPVSASLTNIRQRDLLFPEVPLGADPLMLELSPCFRRWLS
jgi:hypothetical protein